MRVRCRKRPLIPQQAYRRAFLLDERRKKAYNRFDMYIDTHAHLNYDNKYGDMAALLADIAAAGVDTVVNAGWNYDSSALAAEMAEHDNAENRVLCGGLSPLQPRGLPQRGL